MIKIADLVRDYTVGRRTIQSLIEARRLVPQRIMRQGSGVRAAYIWPDDAAPALRLALQRAGADLRATPLPPDQIDVALRRSATRQGNPMAGAPTVPVTDAQIRAWITLDGEWRETPDSLTPAGRRALPDLWPGRGSHGLYASLRYLLRQRPGLHYQERREASSGHVLISVRLAAQASAAPAQTSMDLGDPAARPDLRALAETAMADAAIAWVAAIAEARGGCANAEQRGYALALQHTHAWICRELGQPIADRMRAALET